MPDARGIREALDILLKYLPAGGPAEMAARHDEVYLPGPPPEAITKEDQARLDKLNISYEEEYESWQAFV